MNPQTCDGHQFSELTEDTDTSTVPFEYPRQNSNLD